MARKGRKLAEITTTEVAASLRSLSAVVDRELPRIYWTGEGEWPPIAGAFLARLAELADSVALLIEHGRSAEAEVINRVMYEHMVNFCWIAADPDRRIGRWKDSYRAHLKATYMDALKYGLAILTADELEQTKGKRKLNVEQLATEADTYWAPKIEGFRVLSGKQEQLDVLTITGFYLGVYRMASRIIHATVWSLDRVLHADTRQRIVLERRKSDKVEPPPRLSPSS